MEKKEVLEQFRQGFDCSQVVLMAFAEELGYDEEELSRMAAAFGGGMHRGDTCGAVAGALMALGIRFGNASAGEFEQKGLMRDKVTAFQKAFSEAFASTYCRDILGYDVSVPGEFQKAQESGAVMERCPLFCMKAIEIVQSLIED